MANARLFKVRILNMPAFENTCKNVLVVEFYSIVYQETAQNRILNTKVHFAVKFSD